MKIFSRSSIEKLLIFSCLMALLAPQVAAAATPDYEFFRSNDVIFYDPSASSVCNQPGTLIVTTSAEALQNLKQAYAYFIAKGLTNFQSAGIIGNIQVESGGYTNQLQHAPLGTGPANPTGVSLGWGLVQWTPGSKVLDIQKSAGVSGNIVDLQTQLDVLWWEISTGDEQAVLPLMKAATDVASATAAFQNGFERPKDRTGSLGQRTDFANTAFTTFSTTAGGQTPTPGATPPVSGAATSSDCGSSSPGIVQGNILKTAEGFAQPQPIPKMTSGWKQAAKPSYVSGVQQYNASVLSLGDVAYADCGIFVSTVMRASGVDKNYPPSGTVTQLPYLENNPSKYQIIHNPQMSQLQPGDIMIVNNGTDHHTAIFAGDIGTDTVTNTKLISIDASQGDWPPSYQNTASVQWLLSRPGVIAARVK